jgi:hypothetical protein
MLQHGANRETRSDLAGVMPAHSVGDDQQLQTVVDPERILVDWPDAALVCESVRANHDYRDYRMEWRPPSGGLEQSG